jgi:hypothetical protein
MVLAPQSRSNNGVGWDALGLPGVSVGGAPKSGSILGPARQQHGNRVFSVFLQSGDKATVMGGIGTAKHGQPRAVNVFRPLVCTILMLITLSFPVVALPPTSDQRGLLSPRVLASHAENQTSTLLDVFQVSPPVRTPKDASCQQTLMVHSFAFSYGQPFVGE